MCPRETCVSTGTSAARTRRAVPAAVLRSTPGRSRRQSRARRAERPPSIVVVAPARRGSTDRTAFVGASPPGRIASSTPRPARRAPRPTTRSAPLAPVGDVAIAVVRVLGEHREDQLVDRRPVWAQHGTPVLLAEPVANRAQLATVGHQARDGMVRARGDRSSARRGRRPGRTLAPGRRRADPVPPRRAHRTLWNGSRSSSASAGIALDLPGFGQLGATGDRLLDPRPTTSSRRFADELGLDRFTLVMHDWGSVGLARPALAPARRADRDVPARPFVPGCRWHRVARGWRTPVVGELLMGFTKRRSPRAATRARRPRLEYFDHGTQRAILRLYRSAPPDVLAAAGARLGTSARRR